MSIYKGYTDAQKRANEKYDKENTKVITMKLNKNTDADILDWLESKGKKQTYLKALIRADIEKNKDAEEG